MGASAPARLFGGALVCESEGTSGGTGSTEDHSST